MAATLQASKEDQHFSKYTIKNKLGKGASGTVYETVHVKNESYKFALKVISFDDRQRKHVAQEAIIMKQCNHEHIMGFSRCFLGSEVLEYNRRQGTVSLEQLFQPMLQPREDLLCLQMPLSKSGDLEQFLADCKRRGNYPAEQFVWDFIAKILCALGYLHARKILHRDLKPANILVGDRMALADFSVATKISDDKDTTWGMAGTWGYVCPEMVCKKQYGCKSDLWSFGVTLHQILSLELPFPWGPGRVQRQNDKLHQDCVKHVQPRSVPASWSKILDDVRKCCLRKDPALRPFALGLFAAVAKEMPDFHKLVSAQSIPWSMDELLDGDVIAWRTDICLGKTQEERFVSLLTQKFSSTESSDSSWCDYSKNKASELEEATMAMILQSTQSSLSPAFHLRDDEEELFARICAYLQRNAVEAKTNATALSRQFALLSMRSKMQRTFTTWRPRQKVDSLDDAGSSTRDDSDLAKATQALVFRDLWQHITSGQLVEHTWHGIADYIRLCTRESTVFVGPTARAWQAYNRAPTATEEEELVEYFAEGEVAALLGAVRWAILRLRRDLCSKAYLKATIVEGDGKEEAGVALFAEIESGPAAQQQHSS